MSRNLVILILALVLTIIASPRKYKRHEQGPAEWTDRSGYIEIVRDGIERSYPLSDAAGRLPAGYLSALKAGDRIEFLGDGAVRVERMEGERLLLFGIPVNINEAGVEDLVALPGIGNRTAEAIVAYRENTGRFKSVEELTRIRGIGRKKLEKLRRYVTL